MAPDTMTMMIVTKLITVNTLLRMLDSLTPTANRPDSSKTTISEKKSGYGAKKLTCIGNALIKAFDILLSINASR